MIEGIMACWKEGDSSIFSAKPRSLHSWPLLEEESALLRLHLYLSSCIAMPFFLKFSMIMARLSCVKGSWCMVTHGMSMNDNKLAFVM